MELVETPFGTLRPTLRAGKSINGFFGSYMAALRKLSELDQDAFFVVIAAGLSKKPSEVEDDIFAHGLPDLVEPCTTFVTLLANGGKPIKPVAEGDAKPGE